MDMISQVPTVVVTSAVTTVLTLGVPYGLRHWDELRRRARAKAHSALRIVVTLDEFASSCAEQWATFDMNRGPFGGPVRLPAFPGYAEQVRWGDLDLELAAVALGFENQIRLANASLSTTNITFRDADAEIEAADFCAELGLNAVEIASKLSSRYRLPSLGKRPWTFHDLLKVQGARVREQNARSSLP